MFANIPTLKEVKVPIAASSELAVHKSDAKEIKANNLSLPSIPNETTATVQEVVILISPVAPGQKMKHNVYKVPASKVTKQELFKPPTSKFDMIDAPLPSISPKTRHTRPTPVVTLLN